MPNTAHKYACLLRWKMSVKRNDILLFIILGTENHSTYFTVHLQTDHHKIFSLYQCTNNQHKFYYASDVITYTHTDRISGDLSNWSILKYHTVHVKNGTIRSGIDNSFMKNGTHITNHINSTNKKVN